MDRTHPFYRVAHQSWNLAYSTRNSLHDRGGAHLCGTRVRNQGGLQPLIAVIDDSPTIQAIVKNCLQRASYRVETFDDGIEAFQWFRSPEGEFPVLVFLDIGLPKMDGFDVLRFFRTRPEYSQTMTIMLSCRDGIADRLRGRLAGAFAYVTKPFRTEDILAITSAALTHVNRPLPVIADQSSSDVGSAP